MPTMTTRVFAVALLLVVSTRAAGQTGQGLDAALVGALAMVVAAVLGPLVMFFLTRRRYRSVQHRELEIQGKRNRLKADLQAVCPHIDRVDSSLVLGIRSNRKVYSHGVCVFCDQRLPVSKGRQSFGVNKKEQWRLKRRNRLMRKLDRLGNWRQHSSASGPLDSDA